MYMPVHNRQSVLQTFCFCFINMNVQFHCFDNFGHITFFPFLLYIVLIYVYYNIYNIFQALKGDLWIFISRRHNKNLLMIHLIFCNKVQKKIVLGDFRDAVKQYLFDTCVKNHWYIKRMKPIGIMFTFYFSSTTLILLLILCLY